VEDKIRDQHRSDLFQVLAYGNLATTQRVIACLLFPCAADLWKDLRQENRLIHKAEVQAGTRSVQLWLTAVPMGIAPDEIATPLEDSLRAAVFAGPLPS
jgi:5-methylcytosine-specific restriction endonuclease McrBC regulatory subunit McrC